MPKPKSLSYSITAFSITTGKTSKIDIRVDDKKVSITIPTEVKAYFDDQFSRANPSALQKKKYATIMSLMRAAYVQGKKDACRD